mgnify:CR=1 FL=1
MKDNLELYYELSHKLAMNQLIERFCFELEANKIFFKYLVEEEFIDASPFNNIKTPRNDITLILTFDDEEIKRKYQEQGLKCSGAFTEFVSVSDFPKTLKEYFH